MVVSPGPSTVNKYGARESKEALAELKTKLEFALSRLNDQDTQRTGIEEIREFLQTLYPDWFPMVITCIGEAGANLKPLGRCESVKLLGLLAELHGDAVIPLLQRMLQVVLTRLQDADLHLREACAETVFQLTRSLVVDADGSPVFATLLKPLFAALTEHNKWVQIGAASCICAVIQGSPPSVLSENLQRLSSRLVQHLSLPLAMARPQLLSAWIHVMQAVSLAEFDDLLPSLMPCLELCLNSTADWQTRKQAVEVLQALGDQVDLGHSLKMAPNDPSLRPTPLQKKLSAMMDSLKEDKVRAVREAAKDVLVRWCITAKASPPASASVSAGGERAERPLRSSSPCAAQVSEREQREGARASLTPGPRSTSPGPASWDRDQAARLSEGAGSTGSGGGRTRQVRAPMREREPPAIEEEFASDQARLKDVQNEKAARKVAIQKALNNADLSSTKKPRPKRERVSIFSQPANSSFFQSAQQPATSVPEPGEAVPAEDRLLSSGASVDAERAGWTLEG
ncbi:TORTIFOLIA1-like protein 2, partial [Durusdinium trenchii]